MAAGTSFRNPFPVAHVIFRSTRSRGLRSFQGLSAGERYEGISRPGKRPAGLGEDMVAEKMACEGEPVSDFGGGQGAGTLLVCGKPGQWQQLLAPALTCFPRHRPACLRRHECKISPLAGHGACRKVEPEAEFIQHPKLEANDLLDESV
jgi:hypothetical protein